VKISRFAMIKCVSQAKSMAGDNQAIANYGRAIRQAVDTYF